MIEDYYGTEIEVSPNMASAGPMVDIDRRFSESKRQPRTAPGLVDDFDRLTPEQACLLAIELINGAQEIDPTGTHNALLGKFAEMTREGRLQYALRRRLIGGEGKRAMRRDALA